MGYFTSSDRWALVAASGSGVADYCDIDDLLSAVGEIECKN